MQYRTFMFLFIVLFCCSCRHRVAGEPGQCDAALDSAAREKAQSGTPAGRAPGQKAEAAGALTSDASTADSLRRLTAAMAYEGVNNYCHKEYDWSVAKDNPEAMYLRMGEETDSAFHVIFRSYTGAFVHFYVDKASGRTRMVEEVPSMHIEEEAGTIDLFDYLAKDLHSHVLLFDRTGDGGAVRGINEETAA